MRSGTVISVHVGRSAPLGDSGKPSAFVKAAVAAPVAVGRLGLDGDEQADRRFHGGPDMAVYAYDAGSYRAWSAAFPALCFRAGSMGENLALTGFDEASVCIGDRHRIGTALLEACQPRQPCWKLAAVFGEPLLVKAMFATGRCGWLYRVIEPGVVTAGDTAELVERGSARWTVRRLSDFTVARHRSPELVAEVLAMPALAESWRNKARKWRVSA